VSEPGNDEKRALIQAFTQGRVADAARLAQAMTQGHPTSGFAWKALGEILGQMGQLAQALAPLERAVQLLPLDPDAHCNLGVALMAHGRLADAESHFRRALQIKPDFALVLCNLGGLLKDLGRLDEAEACCRRALGVRADYPEAHCNLGGVLREKGQWAQAEASFRSALRIRPDLAEAHANLGSVLREAGRLQEAEGSCREALRINPRMAEALCNLGVTLEDLGRLDEAKDCYRRAIGLRPEFAGAHSNYLFCLNYSRADGSTGIDAARSFGAAMTAKVRQELCAAVRGPSPVPDRLRIGFVSGDFRNHPVGYFLEGLLAHLDPARHALFGYPTSPHADALTARVRRHFVAWNPLYGKSDEAAARTIRADDIHVLIDLSGHTAHNRLPVFAWRPAPLQVSWLGYFATTGLPQMDYVLADAASLPPDQEIHFTEKVWRLPHSRLCFTRPDVDLPVSALPATSSGRVTFACFNRLAKINAQVVSVWSRVLHAVPGSRLFLKCGQLDEPAVRQDVAARFAACGVPADRLMLEGQSPRSQYLASYDRADICLDPFPFSGATTSIESLWMGVPVVTLAGDCLVARQGVGLALHAGLADWIAKDADEYVEIAARMAGRPDALAHLRASLRERIEVSPLMDARRFAVDFSAALRGMWNSARP